jgi:hypothetical protein
LPIFYIANKILSNHQCGSVSITILLMIAYLLYCQQNFIKSSMRLFGDEEFDEDAKKSGPPSQNAEKVNACKPTTRANNCPRGVLPTRYDAMEFLKIATMPQQYKTSTASKSAATPPVPLLYANLSLPRLGSRDGTAFPALGYFGRAQEKPQDTPRATTRK